MRLLGSSLWIRAFSKACCAVILRSNRKVHSVICIIKELTDHSVFSNAMNFSTITNAQTFDDSTHINHVNIQSSGVPCCRPLEKLPVMPPRPQSPHDTTALSLSFLFALSLFELFSLAGKQLPWRFVQASSLTTLMRLNVQTTGAPRYRDITVGRDRQQIQL
jgi:hypothetical protein